MGAKDWIVLAGLVPAIQMRRGLKVCGGVAARNSDRAALLGPPGSRRFATRPGQAPKSPGMTSFFG